MASFLGWQLTFALHLTLPSHRLERPVTVSQGSLWSAFQLFLYGEKPSFNIFNRDPLELSYGCIASEAWLGIASSTAPGREILPQIAARRLAFIHNRLANIELLHIRNRVADAHQRGPSIHGDARKLWLPLHGLPHQIHRQGVVNKSLASQSQPAKAISLRCLSVKVETS